MPTITQTVKFDEQHLQDLAIKARGLGCKRGYLLKADPKQKKVQQRWCCVYQTFFFYFESESCTRPLGVVFLEGTLCKAVSSIAGQREGGFSIYSDNLAAKQYYFCARTEKEREEWVESITNANTTRIQHDLEELRLRCTQLESSLSTTMAELQHVREANQRAQTDMKKALHTAIQVSPRRRTSSSAASQFSTTLSPSPIPSPSSQTDPMEHSTRVLQGYVRGWLIRRKWKKVVSEYLKTPTAEMIRTRNKLLWKFIASEEDYVSQMTILKEEFLEQCEMAACSQSAPLSLDQCRQIFRNSDELLLYHQLFLRGLHHRIDQWPVVMLGDLLKLFVPMMVIYHQYISNHSHAMETLISLNADPSFKSFLSCLEAKPACLGMTLDQLLSVPLTRIATYIQDLQELHAHTPSEHADYDTLQELRDDLTNIQKAMSDEMCLQTENIRRVLDVERRVEGGCVELLDKDQALLREGILYQARCAEDRSSSLSRGYKLRTQPRVCFLFTKHLLITSRTQKKTKEMYRMVKTLPLCNCTVASHESCDNPELSYRAIKVTTKETEEPETYILLAGSVTEKAQWLGDLTQATENEKQLRILESQSQGQPAELSSRFIRYNTFKIGKEQLVNCGSLDSLLQRLVRVNHLGHDFLNTFFMTISLYTDNHTVMDYLVRAYKECVARKEKRRRASLSPHEAVRGARAIPIHDRPRAASIPAIVCNSTSKTPPPSPRSTLERSPLHRELSPIHARCHSGSSGEEDNVPISVAGIFSALKHWICKHFHHFKEDEQLAEKAEMLIQQGTDCPHLQATERNIILETDRLYLMQQEEGEEERKELEILKCPQCLPPHPFEQLLLWQPRETAEQLCLIDSALFSQVDSDELLRYFRAKGDNKAKAAPHLSAIFDHFNRMSLFFMWSVANQRYPIDRTKLIEFLIQVGTECVQLNNFSSFMQVISGLTHGSVQRFKTAWEAVSKPMKQQYRTLMWLSSTEGRFKELRMAMRKADPPLIPYLGIVLNELSGVVEALPTHLEDQLINFSKMRRCTRLILDTLQHQKEPYDVTFTPEISKILLCVPIPGTEDDLYRYVDTLTDK